MTIEESKRILPTHLQNFLCRVAQLSTQANGQVRAKDFLPRHGIGMEYVKHLPVLTRTAPPWVSRDRALERNQR